jgi:hypothetical protein
VDARVAVLVTSRPCPRRALTSGQQRHPRTTTVGCMCPPSCGISRYRAGRGCFPSSRFVSPSALPGPVFTATSSCWYVIPESLPCPRAGGSPGC